jgi:hypothetical protein
VSRSRGSPRYFARLAQLMKTIAPAFRRERDWPTADLAFVIFAQCLIVLLVRASGPFAISDDDYSRVVIAQEFVEAPRLDPSGSSWLPLPFLLNGTAMWLFGASLEVARATSVFLAVLSALTIYAAATLLGASRAFRMTGTLLSMAVPYSAFAAAATVPEYPTAACLVFAASSLAIRSDCDLRRFGSVRILGAVFVFAASASRYEAWPFALAFAGWNLKDFFEEPRGRQHFALLASAGVALSFPLVWVAYGALHHDSAVFFVKRVVDYKEALGGAGSGNLHLAFSFTQALFAKEPEVVLGTAAGGMALALGRPQFPSEFSMKELLRTWSPFLIMLISLSVGAVRGGTPTHHPERALLSLWLFAPLSLSSLLSRWLDAPRRIYLTITAFVALGVGLRVTNVTTREPFVDRRTEEALGHTIARELPSKSKIAVLSKDFGYFALMSAAGTPSRFSILERHDPREANAKGQGTENLQKMLSEGWCFYVVSPDSVLPGDTVLSEEGPLSLARSATCDAAP